MKYQEKFTLDQSNSDYFSQEFNIIFTCYHDIASERDLYFKNILTKFDGLIFFLDTCENSEKLRYKIENSNGETIESEDNKSLVPDLQNLLKIKNIRGKSICIDITNLKQGILFLLVKLLLNEVFPSKFFAAYTEPRDYKKRKDIVIGDHEEYELYDRIIGSSNGVKGFIKHKSKKNILLIAPMGFDSQRLQTIYENLKPKKLIPVLGFPSFVPGWNLTALRANSIILKSTDCINMIKHCEASSPFELYELLKTEFNRHNNEYDVYICPLGTRPHCLGAAVFVSKYPSTYLIYDFPVEKKYRSADVLKLNIYNLSKYIN